MNPTYFTDRSVDTDRIVYTPSAFAKTSLIYAQEIGTLRALRQHTSHRTKLESFLFFVVIGGAGELRYEGKCYNLKVGDAVFIDCTKPYAHQSDEGALWTLKWIHFHGVALPEIYRKYVERGGKSVFRPKEYAPFVELIDRCFNIASGNSYIRDMELNSAFSELLVWIMQQTVRQIDTDTQGGKVRRVQPATIKAYIDVNYSQKISLELLATRFFVDKTYLARLFKEQYGVTLMEYLYSVRMTKAKELLRFTDETIERIGEMVGMDDSNYFSRVFKKVEGISPSEYRRRW